MVELCLSGPQPLVSLQAGPTMAPPQPAAVLSQQRTPVAAGLVPVLPPPPPRAHTSAMPSPLRSGNWIEDQYRRVTSSQLLWVNSLGPGLKVVEKPVEANSRQ